MKNLIERWTSETPTFFKRIIGISISIGVTGAGILALPLTVPSIVLPAIVITIANHMIVAGAIASAVAKFAKVDVPKN